MMVEWQTIPIREVYAGMYDGPHATPKPSESGPVFLGIKNVGESGQLDLSDVRHISEEEYPRWIKRVEPRDGDIVFSYEATLNRYAMIPKGFRGCLGRRMALIQPDESKAHGRFLYYYFFGQEWRNVIAQNTLIGSTVDRIPIAKFPDFPITIPPIPTQQKIAAILSAYDDLIENNTRRIKILEEMAQAIYREWFVNFRFPGHEKVKMVDSPMGKIPEGWEIFPFSEIFESTLGGDWGNDEPEGEENCEVNIIRGTDFQNIEFGENLRVPRRYISSTSLMKRRLKVGDIIVENSVNAKSRCAGSSILISEGVIKRLEGQGIAASFCRGFRPKDKNLSPLLHRHMRHLFIEGRMGFYQNVAANGIANFQTTRFVERESLILPKDQKLSCLMLETLDSLTTSFLAEKNYNLRQTRDLLLPKLISGELDVSDLDIKTDAIGNG